MEIVRPTEETTVVDVGVADAPFREGEGHEATYNFFEAMYPWPERITAVGLGELNRFHEAFPEIRCVRADGRELPFENGEFDVGFSNAVIEHVGDRSAQQAFVAELCRVATFVFLTTPSRWFPIDPHTLLPFVHWLPPAARGPIFDRLGRSDMHDLRPLGRRELRSLFPYPVRVSNSVLTLTAVGPVRTRSSRTPSLGAK